MSCSFIVEVIQGPVPVQGRRGTATAMTTPACWCDGKRPSSSAVANSVRHGSSCLRPSVEGAKGRALALVIEL